MGRIRRFILRQPACDTKKLMFAKQLHDEATLIEQSQFLDLYPVCSRMISEIASEFIRSWSREELDFFRDKFVGQLIQQGIPRAKAKSAWNLLVQEHAKSENGSPGSSSMVGDRQLTSVTIANPSSSKAECSPPLKKNVFSFEGGRWVVSFDGLTVYPQDITGIKYLHCLISKPSETFSPKELYDGFGGRATRKKPKSMSVGDAIQSGLGIASAQPDVLVDRRGRSEMLARLDAIESEMASAKMVPNADLIERLAMERILIKEQLRKAFTPVGSRRIQEPELVRRMKAVDIAIRRAKEKIQLAGHDALLGHLNRTVEVKVKSGCRYLPCSGATWRTQPVQFVTPKNPR